MPQLAVAKIPAQMFTAPVGDTVQTINAAAAQSVGVPTKAEFDALVFLVNDLRQLAINNGIAR